MGVPDCRGYFLPGSLGSWNWRLAGDVVNTLQFEAVKVALKQDKTGYVLTLCMHPDEIPVELLRDFVGSRYQVVMVRLGEHEEPLDRQEAFSGDRSVKIAGLLCRDQEFWKFLLDDNQIISADEEEASDWLRDYLGVKSRTELKTNPEARVRLEQIRSEFAGWTNKS